MISNIDGRTGASLKTKPTLMCYPLPTFDASDFISTAEAFRSAMPCPLGQSWLATEEPDFTPASVQIGWRGETLLLFAKLIDADIFTFATAHNQPLWELGDTFEIFLKSMARSASPYAEFNVAPNNRHLQLRFSDAKKLEQVRKGSLESALLREEGFHSTTWVRPELSSWHVYAEIKSSVLGETCETLSGQKWGFSFCRYDYTRGRKSPVISSTSPHEILDFHQQDQWGIINFSNK